MTRFDTNDGGSGVMLKIVSHILITMNSPTNFSNIFAKTPSDQKGLTTAMVVIHYLQNSVQVPKISRIALYIVNNDQDFLSI
jgi:hypothetical protein